MRNNPCGHEPSDALDDRRADARRSDGHSRGRSARHAEVSGSRTAAAHVQLRGGGARVGAPARVSAHAGAVGAAHGVRDGHERARLLDPPARVPAHSVSRPRADPHLLRGQAERSGSPATPTIAANWCAKRACTRGSWTRRRPGPPPPIRATCTWITSLNPYLNGISNSPPRGIRLARWTPCWRTARRSRSSRRRVFELQRGPTTTSAARARLQYQGGTAMAVGCRASLRFEDLLAGAARPQTHSNTGSALVPTLAPRTREIQKKADAPVRISNLFPVRISR